jgi:hypothetical protein
MTATYFIISQPTAYNRANIKTISVSTPIPPPPPTVIAGLTRNLYQRQKSVIAGLTRNLIIERLLNE